MEESLPEDRVASEKRHRELQRGWFWKQRKEATGQGMLVAFRSQEGKEIDLSQSFQNKKQPVSSSDLAYEDLYQTSNI